MKRPRHIGFIMDGNRRWARARHMPAFEGHYAGYKTLLNVVRWCAEAGIPYVSFFVFSTENWKRTAREVRYLMNLMRTALERHRDEFMREGVRVLVSGSRNGLGRPLARLLDAIERDTASNTAITVNLCFNYGGRGEIVDAVRGIIRTGIAAARVTEETVSRYLFQRLPDLDLIVRTSGERRLSNFMLWQGAYAELCFVTCHWPAFTRRHLQSVLREFDSRKRRFGA